MPENRNFGQKSKFWSKIEILVKNRNFGQKSTFWSNIEILVKNRNFGQKSTFWSKIEILVKNYGQTKKCPEIEITKLLLHCGRHFATLFLQTSRAPLIVDIFDTLQRRHRVSELRQIREHLAGRTQPCTKCNPVFGRLHLHRPNRHLWFWHLDLRLDPVLSCTEIDVDILRWYRLRPPRSASGGVSWRTADTGDCLAFLWEVKIWGSNFYAKIFIRQKTFFYAKTFLRQKTHFCTP